MIPRTASRLAGLLPMAAPCLAMLGFSVLFIATPSLAAGRGTCGGGPCGVYTDGTEINGFVVDNGANLIFKSGTSATEQLRITATGSIGLGNSTPRTSVDFSVKSDGLILQTASAAAGASCTTSLTGAIRYNSNLKYAEFCNGTVWAAFVASQTPPATTPGDAGYFVMTATTYNGNLGGMAGADASCVTELTGNSTWAGYTEANARGQLNSAHIFSFVLPFAYNNSGHDLAPSSNFYFARVGAPNVGGAYFTTDASSQGPNDNANWAGQTYFGSSAAYWTGRYDASSTYWNNLSASCCGNNDCSSYSTTDSAQRGFEGNPNTTDSSRWLAGCCYSRAGCDTYRAMICFVNPCLSTFSFTDQTHANTSTATASNIIAAPISCSGYTPTVSVSGSATPQFRICSDSLCNTEVVTWSNTPHTIAYGQYLQLRQTSSASNNTAVTETVSIDSKSSTWSLTSWLGYQRVFISSGTYTGNLGGVSGANSTCASLASAAGLDGTWKAFLAVTTGVDAPATTFTKPTTPYKMVNGTQVAANYTALVSGTLSTGISRNENGTAVTASTKVWTNVNTSGGTAKNSGSSSTTNCSGFTDSSGGTVKGNYGLTSSTSNTWIFSNTIICSTATNRIYCIEQ